MNRAAFSAPLLRTQNDLFVFFCLLFFLSDLFCPEQNKLELGAYKTLPLENLKPVDAFTQVTPHWFAVTP